MYVDEDMRGDVMPIMRAECMSMRTCVAMYVDEDMRGDVMPMINNVASIRRQCVVNHADGISDG